MTLVSFCGRKLHDLKDPANVYTSPKGVTCCGPCKKERQRKHQIWYSPLYHAANVDKYRAWGRAYDAAKAGAESEPYTLQDIVARDGTDCGICGEPVDLLASRDDPLRPTIDHIIPLRPKVGLGGSNLLMNVQLAHRRCNLQKGNRV